MDKLVESTVETAKSIGEKQRREIAHINKKQ